ncbi:MFS transporter [Variovorax sp. GB1P17]|uniref:MFS transporter n=1 Tax=Variovorax sp. GB1P17 TaxID=3443740 RepID=UPI003F457FF8
MAALAMPVLAALVGLSVGGMPSILAGVFAAAMYLGATIATLVAGPLIARWGAIRVNQVGLGLCAAGLALGAVGILPGMLAGAFIIGLGYGPITPASSHLRVRSAPPARMSLVFSIKQTGVPLGGLLAGAIAPSLGLATLQPTGGGRLSRRRDLASCLPPSRSRCTAGWLATKLWARAFSGARSSTRSR